MQMLLLGGGLGLTTAPATEAIMGSLSADKAGIGSAVNDTTRELGGTLGVAIAGSIFASVYSGRILGAGATALAGLPAEAMGHSMALAHKVIEQLPAAQADAVRDAVNHAFLDGLQVEHAGLRGHRAGRGDRRRLAAARPGAASSASHRRPQPPAQA